MIWTAFKRAGAGFLKRDGDMQAGYIAYAVLLSIFPFLIFAVSLTGVLIGEDRSEEAVGVLFQFAPPYLAEVVEPVLREVLRKSYGLFTIFIVIALWGSMRAVEAISRAFDRIYGQRETRVALVRKFKALVTVVAGSVVAVALGLSILLAPVIIELLENYTVVPIPENITFLRYAFGTVIFFMFLWVLHWFLPSRQVRGFPIWPGALLSTILWIVMATGLSVYLAYSGNYTLTYGALAGVVITMLFLYFSGAIIIFGAEFNRALTKERDEWPD